MVLPTKLYLLFSLLLPALPAAAVPIQDARAGPQRLRVMTFNIRYANAKDGENVWPLRRHLVTGLIRHHGASVVGLQEALGRQVGDIAAALPAYRHFGTGRDGRAGGERCTLFYDAERLTLVREATFWLSSTPDKIGADWGTKLRRICTWGEFSERATKTTFFVFNTHFDHQSGLARRESAKLLVAKIAEIAGEHPAILMGDLNCTPASAPYATLTSGVAPGTPQPEPELALRDAVDVSETAPYGPPGTWTGFGNGAVPGGRIDYVFVKNDVRVVGHAVIADTWAGRTPSDHRPVTCDVVLGEPYEPICLQIHEGWRFRVDPAGDGVERGEHLFGVDDSDWPVLHAGASWEQQGIEHDGAAWFRRTVDVPATWEESKVTLHLAGVDDEVTLFVNGEEVARIGARTRSFWDGRAVLQLPSEALRFGNTNLFALRVVDYRLWGGLTGFPLTLRTDAAHTTHAGKGLRYKELVELQGFHVDSEQTRTLRFPFDVPALDRSHGWLRFAIHNGGDDTGDGGVRFRLEDEGGSPVQSGYSRASGEQWWEHPVRGGTSWTLVVEDTDTSLGGRNPGNGGQVEVGVRYERKRKPARERKTPRRPRHVPENAEFHAGSWYWFADGVLPYPDAKQLAAEKRGKLLTISSIEENEWIQSRIHGISWMGIERIEEVWTVVDPEAPPFWYWDAGEPNNSRPERFAAIGFDVNGRWHDMLETDRHYVVVEWGDE
ncbi:MAG: hypothetical protein GY711_12555 [bacterium]|nr:hypothetical protein [bacterium]